MRPSEAPDENAPPIPVKRVTARVVTALLVGSMLVVLAGCAVALFCRHALGMKYGLFNFISMFDFYDEATIPTWFTSQLLFVAAALLGAIGWVERSRRRDGARHWLFLSFVFLLLSLDESVSFHERLSWPMRRLFPRDGLLYHGWIVPALAGLLVLGAIYLKFLINLPRRTRNLFIVAAAIYVGAAVGLEVVEGAYESRFGKETGAYTAMVAVEEILEMVGVIVFIYALLDYFRAAWGGLAVVVASDVQRPAPATTVESSLPPPDPAALPAEARAGPVGASPR